MCNAMSAVSGSLDAASSAGAEVPGWIAAGTDLALAGCMVAYFLDHGWDSFTAKQQTEDALGGLGGIKPRLELQDVAHLYPGADSSDRWIHSGGPFDPSSAETQWFVEAFLGTGVAGMSTGNRYLAALDQFANGKFEEAFYLLAPLGAQYPPEGDEQGRGYIEAALYILGNAEIRTRLQEEAEPFKNPWVPGAEGPPPGTVEPPLETVDLPPEQQRINGQYPGRSALSAQRAGDSQRRRVADGGWDGHGEPGRRDFGHGGLGRSGCVCSCGGGHDRWVHCRDCCVRGDVDLSEHRHR